MRATDPIGLLKPQKCISLSLEVGNPRSRYCLMQCLVRVVFLPCRWLSYCVSKSSHGEERDFFLVLHLDTKSAATACSQSCGEPGHHDHHGLTDALGGRVQGCSQPLRLGKAACCPEAFSRRRPRQGPRNPAPSPVHQSSSHSLSHPTPARASNPYG